MHAIIALKRNEPHWMLSEADAKRYGAALSNALRHFPVHATQKALDFSVLVFCVFEMETPRIVRSIQIAKGQVPRHAPPKGPAKIFEFQSPTGSPHGNGASPMNSPGPDGQSPPPMSEAPPHGLDVGGDGGALQ